jgi:RimJ/RimL family protein N-acetyltransferase
MAMDADPEVMRWLGGPVGREESWKRAAQHAGHWLLRGYGNWVVERREDGRFLGRVGLYRPEGWPGLELGWKLARHAWGQGYATEAARAAMAWTWGELGAPRLISMVHPDNAPSLRVAERLGMRQQGELVLKNQPALVLGIERPA